MLRLTASSSPGIVTLNGRADSDTLVADGPEGRVFLDERTLRRCEVTSVPGTTMAAHRATGCVVGLVAGSQLVVRWGTEQFTFGQAGSLWPGEHSFASDGSLLLVDPTPTEVLLWRIDSGGASCLARRGHTAWGLAAGVVPVCSDEAWVTLVDGDGQSELFRLTRDEPGDRLAWHHETRFAEVHAVAPDGQLVVENVGELFLVSADGRFLSSTIVPYDVPWFFARGRALAVNSHGVVLSLEPGRGLLEVGQIGGDCGWGVPGRGCLFVARNDRVERWEP